MSRWQRRYMVKAVHTANNSGSTSRSISPEIFVDINRVLTKFCLWKLGVPVIMSRRVYIFLANSARYRIHFASKYCVLLYWQRYCTALEQWASAKLCGVVSSRDRAAIPFDSGQSNCLHRESKKGATLTMAITLSVLDRFAKFFRCCKEQ